MHLLFIWGWLDVWIWMGEIHFSGHLKGWALKSRLFWTQTALATLVSFSGPQKVLISGPTPSNTARYGLLPHPNPYVPPHINNRYIISYYGFLKAVQFVILGVLEKHVLYNCELTIFFNSIVTILLICYCWQLG